MIPARISIVTLGVRDLASMRAFYGGLGWEEGISTEGFAAFKTGGAVLALFPLDELARDANSVVPPGEGGFRGLTLALNVEEKGRVDEVVGTVRAAGGRIVKEPIDADWGGRSAYFSDPEGNLWEVAWMPGSSFDERGGLILP
ncbi:MAG: VOC family protein [Chloroflexi bacterium]|nr:VOC family protein [Chloroflexota bacterium]